MSYYADNPHERPENPRCLECDDCMTEKRVPFGPPDWECRNPDCPECVEWVVMDSLVELAEYVPPEPDTAGVSTDCVYGACDLTREQARESGYGDFGPM